MTLIRVSISEASRLFGISSKTIRRAIADGELTYVVVRGRYKLNFESLVKWSQQRPTVRNKLAREGIGQFVDQWKIRNRLYSPNPKVLEPEKIEVREKVVSRGYRGGIEVVSRWYRGGEVAWYIAKYNF